MAGFTPLLRRKMTCLHTFGRCKHWISCCNIKWHCCVLMSSCVDADGVSTTATVAITLKETNDFPPKLFPLSGSVCRDAGRMSSGLVVTAVDEDLPPHAAPFTFEMPDDLSINWTVIQVNGKQRMEREVWSLHEGHSHESPKLTLVSFSPFLHFPSLFRYSCCASAPRGAAGRRVCGHSVGVRLWQPNSECLCSGQCHCVSLWLIWRLQVRGGRYPRLQCGNQLHRSYYHHGQYCTPAV